MIKSIALLGFTLSLTAVAAAQMAPPPGAVTHQGTKALPTARPSMGKSMHASKMMKPAPKMKATAKPKS